MALRRWKFFFKRKPVHEATQRAWCRLLFVLAGALPVLLTFIACCAERVPAYKRARVERYAQLLSQVTGLSVQVERVELLTPTRRLLYGVKLNHPETGASLGQINGLWVSETANGCVLQVVQPELTAEQLADCYRLLHEQVLCRPSTVPHAMLLCMNGLVVQSQTEPPLSLGKIQIELKRQPLATEATIKFRLPNNDAAQEAVMTFDRHHDQSEPVSHWTLNTGGQTLPGAWVNRFVSNYSIPGAQAAFTGSLELTYNQSFWNLSGNGHMHRVDATKWFERPLLSGLAFVDVTKFTLTDRGLREAAGSLAIQDGRIHGELLTAAADIDIHAAENLQTYLKDNPGSVLSFQMIEAGFQIDRHGLQIFPRNDQRIIAKDPVGPVARLGKYSLVPMVNLAVCLSKTASTPTARTTAASRLVQWLPNPQADESPSLTKMY